MTDTVAPTQGHTEVPTEDTKNAGENGENAGGHEWNAGTDVPVTAGQARQIMTRDTFMIHEKTWAKARRVYCNWCRQDYAKAADKPCPGPQAEHLHGGTPGERAKRKATPLELRADSVAFMQQSRISFLN